MYYSEYPSGCNEESAYYCLDGPEEMVKESLRHIIWKCEDHIKNAPKDWHWDSCMRLMREAKKYLSEFA
jgi:hypothetical protein